MGWDDGTDKIVGTSLSVQWLRLHASTSRGVGSIPGRGTMILHAGQPKKEIFLN